MTNTALMNVDAFENQLPDAAFGALNAQEESLADGIGQSYGIVGYRGKVWSLRYRGETYQFTRPDDGSPSAFLDCIILRSATYRSKSWYEGGYSEGTTGQRPSCSSLDGVQPDGDVPKKQAEACAICPRNEFKTNANGRKGKDCSDYKRMSVLILPSQSALIFGGQPLMEPVFLRVPAASLNDLAMLGEAMQKKGFHYASYITRIGFDIDKPHPQMTFRALQKLTEKEAPLVLQLRDDPQAWRITGENEVGKSKPSAQIAGSVGQRATAPALPANTNGAASTTTAPTVQQTAAAVTTTTSPSNGATQFHAAPPPEEDEIAKLQRQLAAAQAKLAAEVSGNVSGAPAEVPAGGQQPKAEAGQQPNASVDTGFGLVGTIIPPVKTNGGVVSNVIGLGTGQPVVEVAGSTSTMNTAEDTGPSEDSDADLDARVQGLLQR